MAYIIGTNRPDTDQNVNGGPQQLVSGTPSMLGQMSSGVQAQTGTPNQSGFTNLQRYIEANKDVSGLQGAITQKQQAITSPFEQAKTEAETQKQNVQTAIGGRTQAETSLREAVEKAKTSPTTLSQADISNIRNLATTFNYDPSAVVNPFAQSLAGLQSKAETSAQGLENLATRTGQRQALIEGRVAPRSSLGGLELDAFLLGASPEAQARFEALPTQASQLRQAINPFQTQLGEFQKVGSLTAKDLQNRLLGEVSGVRSGLEQNLPSLIEQKAKTDIDFANRLARREALPGELEALRAELARLNAPTDIQLATSQPQIQNMLSDFFALATPEYAVGGLNPAKTPAPQTELETARRARLVQEQQNKINQTLAEQEALKNLENELATQKSQISYQQVLSPADIARYTAFTQLAGLDPSQFLGMRG
jgi:hypothetical protein